MADAVPAVVVVPVDLGGEIAIAICVDVVGNVVITCMAAVFCCYWSIRCIPSYKALLSNTGKKSTTKVTAAGPCEWHHTSPRPTNAARSTS